MAKRIHCTVQPSATSADAREDSAGSKCFPAALTIMGCQILSTARLKSDRVFGSFVERALG